ncbi:hypothetical protein Pcinc_039195 [Petrolisthes cinctipes]|uniref:Ig-like domain-containing protein n=1 Tax=Petrolisthes cinctipes TaxID=88211 RepID=A0AAE1BP44_PETCI|nr:hypothetical protein Pcinc_039195 [Petrolisthes cinctipes]
MGQQQQQQQQGEEDNNTNKKKKMMVVVRSRVSLTWTLIHTLVLMSGLCCVGVMGVEMAGRGTLVAVENGTVEAVVLDCPFTLEDEDRFEDLVIKWYHNEEPQPIYQWIPASMPPQALGRFVDVVDEGYLIEEGTSEGSTEAHKHRALRLLNPTTDLTGEYRCQVSSFNNYRTMMHHLVVYRKPEEVNLWTKEIEVNDIDAGQTKAVEVMCMVSDVFPQPTVTLTHTLVSGGHSQELRGIHRRFSSGQGSYSAQVQAEMLDTELEGLTEFHCHVSINNTDVRVTQRTLYQPSMEERTEAVTARGGSVVITALPASLVLMLLVLGAL